MEAVDNATIHGVLSGVSPVKSGKNPPYKKYFTGKISDGKKTMRLVSFDCNSRPQMETFSEQKAPVAIRNCAVKSASYGNQGFEVVASPKKTGLVRSTRVFELPENLDTLDPDYSKPVSLEELTIFVPNQRVTVQVKVLKVEGVIEVNKKGSWKTLDKQEVLVGDHSDVTRVVLWEGDVGRLDKGKSYALHSVNTRIYQDQTYLSVSDCTSITEIADIGDVADPADDDAEEETTRTVRDASDVFIGNIISVTSVDVYKSCMACSGKVVIGGDLATCTKCSAMQRAATGCVDAIVARVMLQSADGSRKLAVTMFQNVLSKLIMDLRQKYDEVPVLLLSLPEMCFNIKNGIVNYASEQKGGSDTD